MQNSMLIFNYDQGTLNWVKHGARIPEAKFKGRAWEVQTLLQKNTINSGEGEKEK